MKRIQNRIILILALILITVISFSVTAFAAEDDSKTENTSEIKVYNSFQEAEQAIEAQAQNQAPNVEEPNKVMTVAPMFVRHSPSSTVVQFYFKITGSDYSNAVRYNIQLLEYGWISGTDPIGVWDIG